MMLTGLCLTVLFWTAVIVLTEWKRSAAGGYGRHQVRIRGKGTLSALLAFLLVALAVLAPMGSNASAAPINVGGTPPAPPSYGGTTPAGYIQTSDHINILKVGFVAVDGDKDASPKSGKLMLNDLSTKTDLDNPARFDDVFDRTSFYMAPNAKVDAMIRNTGSGLGYWDDTTHTVKVYSGYGKNIMFGGGADNGSFEKRLLSYADMAYNTELSASSPAAEHFFRFMMASPLYNMDPSNANRNLATSKAGSTIGQNFKTFLHTEVLPTLPKNISMLIDTLKLGGIEKVRLIRQTAALNDYVALVRAKQLLGTSSSAYDSFEKSLRDAMKEGQLRLVIQTVPAFYIKGTSAENGPFTFLPFTDAVEMYVYNRQTARPFDATLQKLNPFREAHAAVYGGASAAGNGNPSDEKYGYMSYSFHEYAKNNYSLTLKPVATAGGVKLTSDVSVNPYGGWGYQVWDKLDADDLANEPKVNAVLDVTVENAKGEKIGQFKKDIDGWAKSDNISLASLELTSGDSLPRISGGMTVTDDEGTEYDLIAGQKARVTVLDTNKTYGKGDKLTKDPLKVATAGQDLEINVPAKGTSKWTLRFGMELNEAGALAKYLGGASVQETMYPDVDNKYAKYDDHGDAEVTVYVKAKGYEPPEPPETEPKDASLIVPQWRLSKYWKTLALTGATDSTFFLNVPEQTRRDPVLTPSGMTSFRLIDPVLSGIDWALSKAKVAPGGSTNHSVTLDSRTVRIPEEGDLLAVKSNKDVMNTKFASWVNDLTFLDRIASTVKGEKGTQADVPKSFAFKYGIKNNSDVYQYSETRTRQIGWTEPDEDGRRDPIYEDYTWRGTAASEYNEAVYNTDVLFKRFLPDENDAPAKFTNTEKAVNGTFWKTKQESNVLSVNPEVAMAYSDTNGNTSVAYTAGDLLRTLQPVTYNLARYINVGVTPDVNGASIATDQKAKQLAATLNSGGKEVIYKGSAINTSFGVKGQVEIKTFALDIGQTALKNSWNPGTTYNTDEINEQFLKTFATKDASGKWTLPLDADGNLKINGREVGGKAKKVTAKQLTPGTSIGGYTVAPLVKEHKLVIRSGKLFSVDGNTNLNALDATLKDALTKAKLMGSQTVFSNFQAAGGDALNEAQYATLANALRGTTDIRSGRGWYNEDSTVLVFREYTTTFEMPQYMYADKIPMQIPGLEAPINKNMYFSKGYTGFTMLNFAPTSSKKLFLNFDSSKEKGNLDGFFRSDGQADPNKRAVDYVVPNVTVLDTFGTQ